MMTRLLLLCSLMAAVHAAGYFEIEVIDDATNRGVPLIELETVNHLKFVTDSAGRVAVSESSFEDRTVFFHVRGHGYEFPKDGFGIQGVQIKVRAGTKHPLKVKRLNIAERIYRITGEGVYRDSLLLGYPVPVKEPLLNGLVLGQDSIQRAIYKGNIHWFWGDTLRLSYPLGNFRMSGAVSELPGTTGLSPEAGVNLRYFTGADGFCKGMFPIEPKGELIWADGFIVLPDGSGGECLIAHYQRLKGLTEPLARGLAIYDDTRDEFQKWRDLDLAEPWRFPHGHPIQLTNWCYFGLAFPSVRVAARTNAVFNPAEYEAFSCLKGGEVNRDAKGKVIYEWTKQGPPATPKVEAELVKAGKLKLEEAHFQPTDAESGATIQIHGGNVTWNAWRKRWILIGVQLLGSSMLGEVWYGEADSPTGPWKKVRKVVTHDRYSFYNPAHHPFFDREGGRIIYFEGTYTAEFSGNPVQTQRYDYNQIMYRLDLRDPRLKVVTE